MLFLQSKIWSYICKEEAMAEMRNNESFTYTLEDKFAFEALESRHLAITEPIDEYVLENIRFHVVRYNKEDKGIPRENRKPIIIYISTLGGNETDGFGIIDLITTSETPIYTVNIAVCYSMGFLIFLAGEKRFSMPNATFLLHDGNLKISDSMTKLKDYVEFESSQIGERTKNYVLNRTRISSKLYNKKQRVEWYMYPEEAKEHGVVTHIIGKDASMSDIV